MANSQTALQGFDIHAPADRDTVECAWTAMRDMKGLYYSADYGGYYVAARYEDVMYVLMHPELFTSSRGITLPPPDKIRSFHIPAETDPPEHRDYRNLVAPLMTPAHARAMEQGICDIVDDLLDDIDPGEPFDFGSAFARPLPIIVSLDLVQLSREYGEEIDNIVEGLHQEVATGTPTGAADRLKAFAEKILDERRDDAVDPKADVVSSILLGEAFGRRLEREEQISMVRLLLVGGFDTTSIALATMMKWICENPADAEKLRGDGKAIDLASEEIVRYASPSTYLRREVMEDCELGGQPLKKGDSVLVAYGAANHDPAKFACPATIMPDRKPNVHLGFGAGRHRCIGSFLAKTQMRVAFEEILDRFQDFKLTDPDAIRYTTGLGQGIISLPMTMARRAG